jgi:crotonobetaine/carnitine-CoA ligase
VKSPLETLAAFPAHDGTLPGLLRSRAERDPERPFLIFEDRTSSYGEVEAAVARAARCLVDRGVKKGDRLAIVAPNSDRWVIAFFALARIGAILVPINPELTPAEIEWIRTHAGASVLSLDEALEADGPFVPEADVRADDLAAIIYTSGTTGFPKGVMHAHESVVIAGEAFVERMHLRTEDRLLCVLPLFHINALFYSLFGALAAGAALILAPRFSASGFWRLAERTGATEVNIIAAIGRILVERPRSEFVPHHRLEKVYGAPIPADVDRVFREEFGVRAMIEGYGLTEAPGVANQPFLGPHKIGSLGRAALHPDHARPFAALRLADEDGRDVGAGEIGELCVKTPIMMKGYYRDPEQTAAAFRDGWFLTGDLMKRDADGFFYFVARKKDIIRRRGENVSGAELDRVIGECPCVLEAATIATPSELGEDEILTVVVLKPGFEPNAQVIADWCRAHLAAIKVPRFVVFQDVLPRTPTHRVAKGKLQADRTLLARAIDLTTLDDSS